MRHYLLFLILILVPGISRANKLTIIVKDYEFDPAQATVYLGDTVMFQWATGNHTTTSTSVPDSAAAWDSPINTNQQFFYYLPTVTGTYSYDCSIHATMGMSGTFTVAPATSVRNMPNPVRFGFWPNPATSFTHVKFNEDLSYVSVYITDITGAVVWKGKFEDARGADLDISNLQQGRYIIYATDGNDVYSQKLLVQ